MDITNGQKKYKWKIPLLVIISIILCLASGLIGAYITYKYMPQPELSAPVKIETSTGDANNIVATIVANVKDSVVEISTEQKSSGGIFNQYIYTGAGSGVIIDSTGLIVTNYHVIEGAEKIKVTTSDGKDYEAEYVSGDKNSDIALLKIDAKNLSAATIGDSSKLVVGEMAIAIGNPLGNLGGTVTEGIISALDRKIIIDGNEMTLLQTSAAVNPGNSGGGLFNANGELIGIVNAKKTQSSSGTVAEGLGFAIPINKAMYIINDLKEDGKVINKDIIGIQTIDVKSDEQMDYYGFDNEGIYIIKVIENSAASEGGLLAGDRISKVNGKSLSSNDEILTIWKSTEIGSKIKFEVERNNKIINIDIIVKAV